jgi:MFS transporter, FHS family, glucose/mannose:H+ symporter
MTETNVAPSNNLKYLLYFGFLLSGISTVLIGPILPFIRQKFQLNDLQLSLFFPMQFAGSIFGTFATNFLSKRYGFMPATVIGCISMSCGVFLMSFDSFYLCLGGFFLNGFGVGLTLPSINMTILELNPLTVSSSLSILNFFWGVGAIISSPFINYFRTEQNIFLPMTIISALLFIVALLIIFSSKIQLKEAVEKDDSVDFSSPIWSNPIAWMIALFNFIHVGFETAMGGWLATYTQRIDANTLILWLPPITLYFLFFVIGRGVAPVFFRFFNDNQVLLFNLIVIFIGAIISFTTADGIILSVGAAIAGFGTSSVFPTNVSRFTKIFGQSASRRATPLFICGTLGAAFTTWIIGFTSNYFNNLRSGLSILFASCLVLIALQIILSVKTKKVIL